MSAALSLYDAVAAAADVIRGRSELRPEVAIVLGTGLGALASEIDVEAVIPYAEIPGFPLSTVESHTGRLLLGRLAGRTVVAMQGRFHRYEGYDLREVTFAVRVLPRLLERSWSAQCLPALQIRGTTAGAARSGYMTSIQVTPGRKYSRPGRFAKSSRFSRSIPLSCRRLWLPCETRATRYESPRHRR